MNSQKCLKSFPFLFENCVVCETRENNALCELYLKYMFTSQKNVFGGFMTLFWELLLQSDRCHVYIVILQNFVHYFLI